jgi:hypothetical protein
MEASTHCNRYGGSYVAIMRVVYVEHYITIVTVRHGGPYIHIVMDMYSSLNFDHIHSPLYGSYRQI